MPGFRAPMLGEEPSTLLHPDIETAVEGLRHELEAFDAYFQGQPDSTPTNPTLGTLDYQEWVIFHNKHFWLHLRQFGLA